MTVQIPSAGTIPNRLRNRRVLVVEDEALVAMLIEEELLEAGARILGPESDIDGAMRLIGDAAPGLIDAAVLDLNLRGTDARPIAAALIERGIPFVIATGYGESALAEAPQVPVLRKPFDGLHLVETLSGVLGLPMRGPPARA